MTRCVTTDNQTNNSDYQWLRTGFLWVALRKLLNYPLKLLQLPHCLKQQLLRPVDQLPYLVHR